MMCDIGLCELVSQQVKFHLNLVADCKPIRSVSNHAVVAGFQTKTLSMAMMSCWSY
jgi:hypothetical protein